MKHYYIIDNKVIEYDYELDESLYNYIKLSVAQSLFYAENPTASLQEVINMELTPPYQKTIEDYREEKRKEIQLDFYSAVDSGYYDQTLNITIRIADEDRNQFNQRITLLNLIPNEAKPATTTIVDINSNPATLTLQEFFTLMLNMGMYYNTSIWGKKVTLDSLINAATTVGEIDNIHWSDYD